MFAGAEPEAASSFLVAVAYECVHDHGGEAEAAVAGQGVHVHDNGFGAAGVGGAGRHVSPIIGPKSVDQLRDNLAALDVDLPAETLGRINAVSEPRLGYPHDFLRMARQMTAQLQAAAWN